MQKESMVSPALDASRNGMYNVVSSRNSTKMFNDVHSRLSPGLSRGKGATSRKVGGKNARCNSVLCNSFVHYTVNLSPPQHTFVDLPMDRTE
jgi:hypothetical protein